MERGTEFDSDQFRHALRRGSKAIAVHVRLARMHAQGLAPANWVGLGSKNLTFRKIIGPQSTRVYSAFSTEMGLKRETFILKNSLGPRKGHDFAGIQTSMLCQVYSASPRHMPDAYGNSLVHPKARGRLLYILHTAYLGMHLPHFAIHHWRPVLVAPDIYG
ncbi:hypothetical protein METSCH_A05680 [Metschnikowia aff. pulcherrima]|uniref:Uncharacterized protein n=1 Tax=Metschnikowia aff. pulcherrima TaxID=2163413 RepID=A0A4P6XEW6_9ASCO|nr:hypothetical protein METSCH_A05680 [Metschnikowia aff. pulcherrima]